VTGFSAAVRTTIRQRAGVEGEFTRCEMCGRFDKYVQLHHRRPRQGKNLRPDTNTAANGISLCMADHAWCEDMRLKAMEKGLLLRQTQSPAAEPVELWDGRWLLGDDGSKEAA
jgi:hypothetical protein